MRSFTKLLINDDASLPQESQAIDSSELNAVSVQAICASGLAGTLELWGCNLPNFDVNYSVKLTDAVFIGVFEGVIPKIDTCYRWLFVRWIPNGSTMTLTVYINGQGF